MKMYLCKLTNSICLLEFVNSKKNVFIMNYGRRKITHRVDSDKCVNKEIDERFELVGYC